MTVRSYRPFVDRVLLAGLVLVLCGAAADADPVKTNSTDQPLLDYFHATVTAATARPDSPDWLTRPVWTRRPTIDDIWQTYPSDAYRRGVRGRVEIVCRVDDGGDLKPCEVESEEPVGQGFGSGGLQLSRRFRMKRVDALGVPAPGRLIRIPIAYGPAR